MPYPPEKLVIITDIDQNKKPIGDIWAIPFAVKQQCDKKHYISNRNRLHCYDQVNTLKTDEEKDQLRERVTYAYTHGLVRDPRKEALQ